MKSKFLPMLPWVLFPLLIGCGTGRPDLEGKTISRVTFHFSQPTPVNESRWKSLVSSRVGSSYSTQRIDEDIKALYESGDVEDARIAAEPEGDKVGLRVEILPRPPMGPSGFVGNASFSDATLARETGLKAGENLTEAVIEGAAQRLENFYRTRGFRKAEVTPMVLPEEGSSSVHLRFEIVEGNRQVR